MTEARTSRSQEKGKGKEKVRSVKRMRFRVYFHRRCFHCSGRHDRNMGDLSLHENWPCACSQRVMQTRGKLEGEKISASNRDGSSSLFLLVREIVSDLSPGSLSACVTYQVTFHHFHVHFLLFQSRTSRTTCHSRQPVHWMKAMHGVEWFGPGSSLNSLKMDVQFWTGTVDHLSDITTGSTLPKQTALKFRAHQLFKIRYFFHCFNIWP